MSTPEAEAAAPPAAPPAKRPWLRPLLAVGGYAAIGVLAWRALDHERLAAGLARLRVHHILLVLAISLLHIAGRAFRYHRLVLRNNPTDYRWTDGFAIFLIGLSTSAVTPARAGDFVKAQLVRRHGVPMGAGFGLVLIERVLDLLVMTAAILLAGLAVSSSAAAIWSRAALVLLGGLVVAVAAITNKTLRGKVGRIGAAILLRVAPKKALALESKVLAVFETWDAIFTSPVTLAGYFLGSCAVWSVEFAKLWVVLMLIGAPASLPSVFFIYPVSILAGVLTLLPFSEGVVGVTGVALLASIAGVDPANATIAIVLDRGMSALPPLALAATSFLWRRSGGETT